MDKFKNTIVIENLKIGADISTKVLCEFFELGINTNAYKIRELICSYNRANNRYLSKKALLHEAIKQSYRG